MTLLQSSQEVEVLVVAICDRFEQAWQRGVPNIHDFLPDDPTLHRAVLVDLVGIDLERRWEAAANCPTLGPGALRATALSATNNKLPERPRLADYARHFPAIAPVSNLPVHLFGHEFEVLQRWGPQPDDDQYLSDCGRSDEDVRRAIQAARQEILMVGDSGNGTVTFQGRRSASADSQSRGQQLLKDVAQGNDDALQLLLFEHYDWLTDIVNKIILKADLPPGHVEEVVELVNTTAFQSIRSLEIADMRQLKGWLRASAESLIETLKERAKYDFSLGPVDEG